MGLTDILERYASSPRPANTSGADSHFDQVARVAPTETLGQGLADAFRAESTPSFGLMVGQLFGQSSPQQKADVLNYLLRAIGPGISSTLGGGIVGRLGAASAASSPAEMPQVTPYQASQLIPQEVQEIAAYAEKRDPSVLDTIGRFYAQHPQLVKTLGSAALVIALAGVANRMRR